MSTRVYLLLPLVFTLASLHLLPFVPGRERLFGIVVKNEIRYGREGQQFLRRYQLYLLPWTAIALMCSVRLPLSWAVFWIVPSAVVPFIAACIIFSRLRVAARRLLPPALPVPRDPLHKLDNGLLRRVPLYAIPLTMEIGTGLYLHLHWNEIPERFPIRWDANGVVTAWSDRTLWGVYGQLFTGVAFILLLMEIIRISSLRARKKARSPESEMILLGVAYIMALGYSMVALRPLCTFPPVELVVFYIASLVFLVSMVRLKSQNSSLRGVTTANVTAVEKEWHYDHFYFNPQDASLFVEKRAGSGLTLNFGNCLSWILLEMVLLLPLGLLLLAMGFMKK